MVSSKEQQPVSRTPEEQALEEIQGYIEQTEKKPEIPADISQILQQLPSAQPPLQTPVTDNNGKVVMQNAAQQPPIILPLDQAELEKGLHMKVLDSLRWLSEQCVMLIKKYPGRVFFNSPSQT